MKKTLTLLALSFAVILPPAHAATISLVVNSPVASTFDVAVQATNVFAGRAAGDLLEAFGFNVTIGNGSIFKFTGETAGPLFTDVSDAFGGSPMVAGIANAPAGIGPADFTGPLTLATLHFSALKAGTTTIGVTSDSSDPNQGLVFANLPFGAINASTSVTAAAVPEPGTMLLSGLAMAALCLVRARRRL